MTIISIFIRWFLIHLPWNEFVQRIPSKSMPFLSANTIFKKRSNDVIHCRSLYIELHTIFNHKTKNRWKLFWLFLKKKKSTKHLRYFRFTFQTSLYKMNNAFFISSLNEKFINYSKSWKFFLDLLKTWFENNLSSLIEKWNENLAIYCSDWPRIDSYRLISLNNVHSLFFIWLEMIESNQHLPFSWIHCWTFESHFPLFSLFSSVPNLHC